MEIIKGAFRNIFRQRSRSMLTILGIAIGVFSVVLIGTISDMGKSMINAELDSLGIDGLAISSVANSGACLSENELDMIKSSETVVDATPLLFEYVDVDFRNEKTKTVIMGIDSNADQIISLVPIHGRLINQGDVASYKNVCVVDEAFAKATYRRSNIVGKQIKIDLEGKNISFQVVGVVKTGGNMMQNMMGSYVPNFIYLPYTTQKILTGNTDFDQIAVKLKKGEDTVFAEQTLSHIMDVRFGRRETVKIENLSGYKQELNTVLSGVGLILGVIAGISLVVAGLSIMTVMLVSVNERTKEIGIKKSIGASSGRIVKEFMLEALFLSILGSLIGAMIGILVGGVGGVFAGIGFSINGGLILSCVGFAVFTGLIFGAYPALKAARLKPADALRRE